MNRTFVFSLTALCVLLGSLFVWEQTKGELISEGTDTVCEVNYPADKDSRDPFFLSEGDRIAVISPSALPSKEQAEAVIAGLKAWGYVPVEGKHAADKTRTIDDIIEDLRQALEDPSIQAVFCIRGGYGASEVMDRIPEELIVSAEKPIIGYSDITVYHAAWTAAGLPSIHASMSAAFSDLPEECEEAEQRILKGDIPSYKCESNPLNKPGDAEGILVGGNLSTFLSVLDTAYDSTALGQPYILFLEDVGEDIQHIHRSLTVLKHRGILEEAAGIIFGEWTELPEDPGDYSGSSRGADFASVADMISRQFPELSGIPVAFGFPAGHGDVNYPMLMGEPVRLRVNEAYFTLDWNE